MTLIPLSSILFCPLNQKKKSKIIDYSKIFISLIQHFSHQHLLDYFQSFDETKKWKKKYRRQTKSPKKKKSKLKNKYLKAKKFTYFIYNRRAVRRTRQWAPVGVPALPQFPRSCTCQRVTVSWLKCWRGARLPVEIRYRRSHHSRLFDPKEADILLSFSLSLSLFCFSLLTSKNGQRQREKERETESRQRERPSSLCSTGMSISFLCLSLFSISILHCCWSKFYPLSIFLLLLFAFRR